jgi:polyisoprenoid-binding protein YceI
MAMKAKQNRFYGDPVRLTWICALLTLAAAHVWAESRKPSPEENPRDVTVSLDPAQSKLNWTLGTTLHTVHGTFGLKRGILKFDPASGNASGEFVADAASGQSGNDSRDKKMHGEILESWRFGEVIFRPNRIDGKVLAQGASSVQLHGTFLLHGGEHELTVPVQAELNGNRWKGSAKFSVPYIQWGLKSPNTFLLKADPAVEIELELSGIVEGTAAP